MCEVYESVRLSKLESSDYLHRREEVLAQARMQHRHSICGMFGLPRLCQNIAFISFACIGCHAVALRPLSLFPAALCLHHTH